MHSGLAGSKPHRWRDPGTRCCSIWPGWPVWRLSLWGKAQQLLKQSLSLLQDPRLKRDAWHALARMAEQRNEADVATHAYQQALKESAKT